MPEKTMIKVVIYGMGQVGSGAVRLIAEKDWMKVVGAIDVDKEKIGKDAGYVAGLDRKLGVIISDDPKSTFAQAQPDVVIYAVPVASYEKVEAELLEILETGVNVISTTDARLCYPWYNIPEFARRIDEVAKKKRVTVLGTGLNPGFINDLVPITFTGVCEKVKRVRTQRVSNLTPYSPAVVKDYFCIGVSIETFERRLASGTVRFAAASTRLPMIDMIANALGWKLDEVTRQAKPMVSSQRKRTLYGQEIEAGMVCGVETVQSGVIGKEAVVVIEWMFTVEPEKDGIEVFDRIIIEGEPNLDVVVRGLSPVGTTYAHAVNCIPQVIASKPGLTTVRELPVAAAHV